MRKICSTCLTSASPVFDELPPSAEYAGLVAPEFCEKCAEKKAATIARLEKNEADWMRVKLNLILIVREIPRDSEWKAHLIDMVLPPN